MAELDQADPAPNLEPLAVTPTVDNATGPRRADRRRAEAEFRPVVAVRMAGKPTALGAPGGGEVQMFALAQALRVMGLQARPWRPWEDDLCEVDCLHLFGSLPEHLPVVEAARRRGVPVVLSTIAWFAPACVWREPRPLIRRLAGCAALWARARWTGLPSWRRRLYHAVDRLLPNSQAEAEQLVGYYGVPAERIDVVPNGTDPRFARGDAEPFARLVGGRGFVLCPGRIEPRKNQLGLIRAMRGAGVPMVVLGDAVPGHASYGAACRRAADRNVRFVRALRHDDPLLASAYAACGCLALASWFETPGLVALEAAASGVPLVLPRGGCAAEYFGDLAEYVRPHDGAGIRRAVLAALRRRRDPRLAEHVLANFTWDAAARATCQAYDKVL